MQEGSAVSPGPRKNAVCGDLRSESPTATGSARSLLLTVLGEFVHPHERVVWTSSLLHVLTGVGLEEQTARQAISRCAAAGWLVGRKRGRKMQWELTPVGCKLIEDGAERVRSMSSNTPRWSGEWLVLLVTVPQSHRSVRKKLYSALNWTGFGNPTATVWVSPHADREAEARRVIDELGLSDHTLAFVGSSGSMGMNDAEIVQRAWNLRDVSARYEGLLEEFSGLTPSPGDPMLFAHARLVNAWQRFPFMDPHLPEELLPGWVGHRAVRMVLELRDRWYDDAQSRWRDVAEGAH